MTDIVITDHAYMRAKERLSFTKSVLDKMALKAYTEGIKHSETRGRLNKYITSLWFAHKTANNVRLHGQVVYIFSNNTLITVFQLEHQYKKYNKKN